MWLRCSADTISQTDARSSVPVCSRVRQELADRPDPEPLKRAQCHTRQTKLGNRSIQLGFIGEAIERLRVGSDVVA